MNKHRIGKLATAGVISALLLGAAALGAQAPAPLTSALVRELNAAGSAARSMPYHLYRAYGAQVLPDLEKAARESPNEQVRAECRKELENARRATTQPTTLGADTVR